MYISIAGPNRPSHLPKKRARKKILYSGMCKNISFSAPMFWNIPSRSVTCVCLSVLWNASAPHPHRLTSHLRHTLRILVQFGAQRPHPLRFVARRPQYLVDGVLLLLHDSLQSGALQLQLDDACTHVFAAGRRRWIVIGRRRRRSRSCCRRHRRNQRLRFQHADANRRR